MTTAHDTAPEEQLSDAMDADHFRAIVESSLSPLDKRRTEIMARVHGSYIATKRDADMSKQLQRLVEGALRMPEDDDRLEGRALVVMGKAGAGKTSLIKHAIDKRPEFQPDGDFLPFVRLKAPSPCTLKQLGRKILHRLGYPLERNLQENETWDKVRNHLQIRRTRIVWIDEMHHALRGTDSGKLAETLKNAMQQEDWRVSLILSGVPALARFLAQDEQLSRRKNVIELKDLEWPGNAELIQWLVRQVICKHAGMTLGKDLQSDEFLNRLCHASVYRFGMLITMVRIAVEEALYEPEAVNTVNRSHFAAAYADLTSCERSTNVFEATDWHHIDPEPLLFTRDDDDQPTHAEQARRARRK